MTTLNEDSLYVRSSQYRLWSFSSATLSSLRTTANTSADERVRKRRKLNHDKHPTSVPKPSTEATDQPLTSEEELTLLSHHYLPLVPYIVKTYFDQIYNLENVRNTAAQYIRRFYLTRSLMDPLDLDILSETIYTSKTPQKERDRSSTTRIIVLDSPTIILIAALYLSTKINDAFIPLDSFLQRLREKGTREHKAGHGGIRDAEILTIDLIKRAEQLLTRGLLFTFEVRHASDGLTGLEIEFANIFHLDTDNDEPPTNGHTEDISKSEGTIKLRDGLLALTPSGSTDQPVSTTTTTKLPPRITNALSQTRALLKTAVHASDAYFLFTPSQILFAALTLADKDVADLYLSWKLDPGNDADADNDVEKLKDKILSTIKRCSDILSSALAKIDEAKSKENEMRDMLTRLADVHDLLSSSIDADAEGEAPRSGGKRLGSVAFSSSDEGEDEDGEDEEGGDDDDEDEEGEGVIRSNLKKKKRKKRRRIEDDDVFGGPL